MGKNTIIEVNVKYDDDVHCWLLDVDFEHTGLDEIFGFGDESEIPPQEVLDADFMGLTLPEAKKLLVEKYGMQPGPTSVSFFEGMAHFEDGDSIAATPEMVRAMPEILSALRASVRTLHHYGFLMREYWPTTTYPAGIEAEEAARNLVNKLVPGLDMWGLPLPKENRHEQ